MKTINLIFALLILSLTSLANLEEVPPLKTSGVSPIFELVDADLIQALSSYGNNNSSTNDCLLFEKLHVKLSKVAVAYLKDQPTKDEFNKVSLAVSLAHGACLVPRTYDRQNYILNQLKLARASLVSLVKKIGFKI